MFYADDKDRTINCLGMTGLSFEKGILELSFTYWHAQNGAVCGMASTTHLDIDEDTAQKFKEFVKSAEMWFGKVMLGPGQFEDMTKPKPQDNSTWRQ